jgi:uncharacterized caspase-like protein
MLRLNLIPILLVLVMGALSLVADSAEEEGRGIVVKLRADDDPTAPVSETVRLYGQSYALVIGIDDYTGGWPRLDNAVADARAVATELEARGFQVTLKTNLNATQLQQSLKEFFAIKGADPQARLFLWYAGHGHTIKGEGFLVPADAPPPASPEFKLKALHLRDFGGLMRLADSKHVFSVFDSCFAGTIFVVRAGAPPAAITRATTRPVRQFLSSGDADQTVSDDGTFRKLFLRALRGEERADANGDGYLTASELGLYLADRVTNITEQAQTPRYGKLRDPDYDRGDFVFLLPGREPPKAEPGLPARQIASEQDAMVEITFWASVAASDKIADFENYLQKYPDGNFASIARTRIEALKSQQAQPRQEPLVPAPVAEKQKTLQVSSTQELVEAGKAKEEEWMPVAPSQQQAPFRITAQTELSGDLLALARRSAAPSAKPGAATKGTAELMSRGRVAADAWKFSNPQGDGRYRIDGEWIHMRSSGGRNIWDCRRGQAPLLTVQAPNTEAWTALVRFELAGRVGASHVGLAIWNGHEDTPVHALYVGPSETGEVSVAGSYRDDCSGRSGDLARLKGNSGVFQTNYAGASGWLRISKKGGVFSFYFKSPFKKDWQSLGEVLTTVKDGFDRVGLITKTWGNQPVQVSFHEFRLLPGIADFAPWVPAYFTQLEKSSQVTFAGKAFSDFEWSDPQGDSLHEVTGKELRLKAQGGHNIWDCRRLQAPMVTVATPDTDTWTAQVKFAMPSRIGASQVGMVLWNGSEDRPAHALYFGPAETQEVSVAGSYRDDCSAQPNELAYIPGNAGDFRTNYEGATGWLRVARAADTVSFYFRSPNKKQWQKLGSVLTTRKDGFDRIGLIAKTWAGNPVEVNFSDFTIASGVSGTERWVPAYYSRLTSGEAETFSGREYSDFEWSDPLGDSVNQIEGARVLLRANGGHNIWDCKRGAAPMLTVEAPPHDSWIAQARFEMPKRVGGSQVGLALWNGSDDRPANALYVGPADGNTIAVAGSYQDDCSAQPHELARIQGNTGKFQIPYTGTSGWLRIVKTGTTYGFWAKVAGKDWQELGSVLTTVKDGFNRIGMMAKTWGGAPVEVTFSDFTLLPGGYR